MKASIKNISRLFFIMTFAMGIITFIGIIQSKSEMDRLETLMEVVHKWDRMSLDLDMLTSEYVFFPSKQRLSQWNEYYNSTLIDLAHYKKYSSDYPQIELVIQLHQKLPEFMQKIVTAGNNQNKRNTYILNLQSLMKRITLISSKILSQVMDEGKALREYLVLIMAFFLVLLLISGVVVYALFTRWVDEPIQQIKVDLEMLGSGGLDKSVKPVITSELNEIVKAVENTRQDLARQTISREHLEVEVENRTLELTKRTQELEKAYKDLEGFSYSVSHDLRSPLRAIDGFISIMIDDYSAKFDEEGQRLMAVISDNATKMGRLIDDVLALARAGRTEINYQKINMNTLVEDVWMHLAKQRDNNSYQFKCGDLPEIYADAYALQQILEHLLANAIKFTRDTDSPVIEVSAIEQDNTIRYSIKDNGVGFNQEYVGKLFVLFQRLHGMDEYEGTGVGLAMVNQLIKKHNGFVEAQGQLNEGATFSFTLPKSNEASNQTI